MAGTRASERQRARYVNLALLVILGTIWGASYLFIKVTVAEVPTLTLVSGRLVVSSALMWIILYVLRVTVPRGTGVWGSFAMLGLCGAAVPYSLITWGEQYIPSGLAALLQATTPIFTVLLAQFVIEDERIDAIKVGGVIVGFAGVVILILPDLQQGVPAGLLGQLAIVGASLCYAWTAIFARRWLKGQSPLVTATGQLTMGAALILPVTLVTGQTFAFSLSWPALASWLGLTLLGTVLAYGIYFTLIRRTSATFTTMVTYIIPVNGLILGALVLKEPLNVTVLVSLGLILLGVILVRGREGNRGPS